MVYTSRAEEGGTGAKTSQSGTFSQYLISGLSRGWRLVVAGLVQATAATVSGLTFELQLCCRLQTRGPHCSPASSSPQTVLSHNLISRLKLSQKVKDSQILHQSILKLAKGMNHILGICHINLGLQLSVGTGTRPWRLSAGRHATGRDQAGLGDRSAFQ